MQTLQDIPTQLRRPVEAALSWINRTQGKDFELTGLVDYEGALSADAGEGYELGLVLCDGEICAREQIRIEASGDGYEFGLVEIAQREIPPLLDPPIGLRGSWLENELTSHEFVLLLFYRGLW